MRFMIVHKTNAHWEGGAIPSRELIARVGEMLGTLSKAGALESGEGLRPSAEGARVRFEAGAGRVIRGPFDGGNALPAGFTIVRARSLDEAIEWAARQSAVLGDGEVDIRPVTEPWDIGMRPAPADAATRRYMIVRNATAATESGQEASPEQRAALSRLIDEGTRTGTVLANETLRRSARGRRYKNARDGVRVIDGPFTESKELIGGYVIVSAGSLDEADRWARLYIDTVEAEEVDLREIE